MKIHYIFFFQIVFFSNLSIAQFSPGKINYQSVIRNSSGQVLPNKQVSILFEIVDLTGLQVFYSEKHIVTSNSLGMVNVSIGGGEVVSGNYLDVDWAVGRKLMRTSLDTSGGNSFVLLGAIEFLVVPYAMVAYKVSHPGVSGNTGFGSGAMSLQKGGYGTSTAMQNTAIGYNSFSSNSIGSYNTALGSNSMFQNLTGNNNTSVGYKTLYSNVNGSNNVAIGIEALLSNVSGSRNVAVGNLSQNRNTSGYSNTSIGAGALMMNNVGPNNVAIGTDALSSNIDGNRNVAVGVQALSKNTSGIVNNAFGYLALLNSTTAVENNAFGHQAMEQNTIGSGNSGFGHNVLQQNNDGNGNTAMGYNVLNLNKASFNSSFGWRSLQSNIDGIENVAMGEEALTSSTGSNLSAFGAEAGKSITTGSNNTMIGTFADVTDGSLNNATAIGFRSKVSISNALVLGGTGADAVNVGIGTTSPARSLHVNAVIRLEPISSPPSSPSKGDMYFDSSLNKLRVFDGTIWQNCW